MAHEFETEDGEIVTVTQSPPPGTAIQRVEGQFVTAVAVQKPRSLPNVQKRLDEEANLGGESFYYGWGAGKDAIEGPSVKLAMAAVRCWGNCSVEMLPLSETPESWVFTAAFVDYETGFTLQRQFRQSKTWTVHGKLDAARKDDIRFQIGQSKAVRNVILNALPIGLIDAAMETAKDGARKKLTQFIDKIDKQKGAGAGIVHAVDLVLTGLAKHGVKEHAILAKLEIADRKAINLDRLLILRGNLTALDAGETRAEDLYPPPKTEQLADKLAGKLGGSTEGKKVKAEDESAKKPAKKPSEPTGDPSTDEPEDLFENGTGAAQGH